MKWLLIIIFMYNCFAQEMREVEVPSDGPRQFVAQINDYCTATFISPTMLITAQHCVDDIQNNSLPSKDYLVYRARTSEDVFENVYSITSVKQLSSKRDIALVTVEPPLNTEGEAFPSVKCTDITTLIGNGTQAQLTGYPGDTGSKLREANCYVGRAVYLQDRLYN
jgi:V8-like Glu-specific endopeptidase